jgi:hypothetical protein
LTVIRGWKWTLVFGAAGAVLVILLSAWRNPPETILLRSLIAFCAFTAIAFAVRFALLNFLASEPGRGEDEDRDLGRLVDVTVPDEGESITRMIQQQWLESKPAETGSNEDKVEFKPLEPKRLTTLDRLDPEKIAGAIRHMTDEEGR